MMFKTTIETRCTVIWFVKIWIILHVSWNVKKEEVELISCSSSCVQWKIKLWQIMWPYDASLWSFSKLHGQFNNSLNKWTMSKHNPLNKNTHLKLWMFFTTFIHSPGDVDNGLYVKIEKCVFVHLSATN